MSWLAILFASYAGLHYGVLVPTQPAIVGATVVTVVFWILWKLKWVILGIIGLEEIFGGRGDSA